MDVIHRREEENQKVYVPKPIYNASRYVTGNRPVGFVEEPYDDMLHFTGEKKVVKRKTNVNAGYSEYERKDYHRLVEAISFNGYKQCPGFETKLKFFKFLAKRPDLKQKQNKHQRKLQLWIPDTIVYNDTGSP